MFCMQNVKIFPVLALIKSSHKRQIRPLFSEEVQVGWVMPAFLYFQAISRGIIPQFYNAISGHRSSVFCPQAANKALLYQECPQCIYLQSVLLYVQIQKIFSSNLLSVWWANGVWHHCNHMYGNRHWSIAAFAGIFVQIGWQRQTTMVHQRERWWWGWMKENVATIKMRKIQ